MDVYTGTMKGKPKPPAKKKPPVPKVTVTPVPTKGAPTGQKMKPPAKAVPDSKKMQQPKQADSEIKETGTYKGKSNTLGGGGRFAQLEDKLEAKGKSPDAAAAIAASVGRKKFGAAKMASMAAKGRKSG